MSTDLFPQETIEGRRNAAKLANPGTVIAVKVGDFYEFWNDDAALVAKALNITLTARRSGESSFPMCGIPYHSVDRYLKVLAEAGIVVAHLPPLIHELTEEMPAFVAGLGYKVKRLRAYGNLKLLDDSAKLFHACDPYLRNLTPLQLETVERVAEEIVLAGNILVCSTIGPEYQRAAVVPLRWGCPRILVIAKGLHTAMGPELKEELFRAARLWRYQFDPQTDLVLSQAPDNGGIHCWNPRVARMIQAISKGVAA